MNAIHFQAVTGIIIAVVLGLVLANDPYPTPDGAGSFGGLNVYVFLGTMLGLVFAGIYILVNLACIGYFWRERRDEFNVIKHLLIPVLGVIAMIPALLSVIGGLTIPILDIKLDPYASSLKWTAPLVGAWVVLGIVVYIGLWVMNRAAADTGWRGLRRGREPGRGNLVLDRWMGRRRRRPIGSLSRRCPAGSGR